MNFYAVIIGTEILNGRRSDKHFEFLKEALCKRGHTLFASFIIKDDPALIANVFALVKADDKAVMFSFGGIGSTPDDLTREIAAKVFTCKSVVRHQQFEKDIVERFGDEAYPHRIHMADLPRNAKLLKNIVNNMSGFYLNDRFFFVPGFPEMAHIMVEEALEMHYATSPIMYRKTLIANTSENSLISIMKELPENIEFSSLPMITNAAAAVELSLASQDSELVASCFEHFISTLIEKDVTFTITQEQ